MKDFLNYYTKNLILHIYKFSGLNKIVISGLDISKFLLKRSKYSSLIEYTLIDDNFDETNLRFKEIIEYRDYKNKLEIGFISKNSENERNSLSEIVVSAYSAERENFDLYGVTYRGHKDLRRILTSYGLQGNPLHKDFPMSGYLEIVKISVSRIEYKSIKLGQYYRNIRNFSSDNSNSGTWLIELGVLAIREIMRSRKRVVYRLIIERKYSHLGKGTVQLLEWILEQYRTREEFREEFHEYLSYPPNREIHGEYRFVEAPFEVFRKNRNVQNFLKESGLPRISTFTWFHDALDNRKQSEEPLDLIFCAISFFEQKFLSYTSKFFKIRNELITISEEHKNKKIEKRRNKLKKKLISKKTFFQFIVLIKKVKRIVKRIPNNVDTYLYNYLIQRGCQMKARASVDIYLKAVAIGFIDIYIQANDLKNIY
jgi:NADH:ubiquinone oxidoreductase subunit C